MPGYLCNYGLCFICQELCQVIGRTFLCALVMTIRKVTMLPKSFIFMWWYYDWCVLILYHITYEKYNTNKTRPRTAQHMERQSTTRGVWKTTLSKNEAPLERWLKIHILFFIIPLFELGCFINYQWIMCFHQLIAGWSGDQLTGATAM